MYHPLTPGQSWVQSPVSFRRKRGGRGREGEVEEKRERGRQQGDSELWTDTEGGVGGKGGKVSRREKRINE